MNNYYEVPVEKLKRRCDLRMLCFKTTKEVPPLKGMIGQERAMKAMEFGLRIKSFGYNVYMAGAPGTGKISYAKEIVENKASNEMPPDDWCYVYNFNRPDQPLAINFPPGKGVMFVKNIEELLSDLRTEIPKVFNSQDYEKEKQQIMEQHKLERDRVLEDLNKVASDYGFMIKWTNTGFLTVPIANGKVLSEEEYLALDDSTRTKIEANSLALNKIAMEAMKRVIKIEKQLKEDIDNLEKKIGLFAVGHLIDDLKAKYSGFVKVQEYLDALQKDVLLNLDNFKGQEDDKPDYLVLFRPNRELTDLKYKVNLFVDNSQLKGAPVVIESNPTYYNLIGRVEYENNMGVATTNFMKIKAGALHRANGGYLIVQIKDVLSNPQAYDALKRVLKTKKIVIENIGDQLGIIATSSLKPEAIPLNVKVIVIGNPSIYHILYQYDEDFSELFKIKADFDTEMEYNRDNIHKLCSFISSHCEREGLRHFDRGAVGKIIEYSTRLANDQNKLTTRFNEIVELLHEANAWAETDAVDYVSANYVEKAIEERKSRLNKYEEKIQELLEQGTLMIETQGEKVGQINGLSVLDFGDYVFGKPSKITASTWLGRRGIINIEREIEMSGKIHSKGVLILSGYLGQKYAQEEPLNLSATLCFEQLYEGVEGDSASSTELYAILSSLSGLPIKQGIAVTGSVNQKGEIQPIGGVTQKIEGFFELCKRRGLTGEQGVLIPYQNIHNLVLNDEVIDAVKNRQFHIFPVETINQGIEILTGVPAGELSAEGKYPEKSVHGLVAQKLSSFTEALKKENKDEELKK